MSLTDDLLAGAGAIAKAVYTQQRGAPHARCSEYKDKQEGVAAVEGQAGYRLRQVAPRPMLQTQNQRSRESRRRPMAQGPAWRGG